MSAAVMHVNSSTRASTSPTMRIARFVADELGVPLIHDPATARQHAAKKFDVLFVKYGMLKFSNHRDEALQIHEQARYVVNLENDYTFVPDKRFHPADETWSTVEGRAHLVNWNVLTRLPPEMWRYARPLTEPTRRGLIYYGAHREDRILSFRRYFTDPPYPLTISTYRGQKKFQAYGKNVQVVSAFRDPDAQNQWQATLYIEDETSHDLYCSPATRFYECVMAGLAQLIDREAAGTLEKAGVPGVDAFVVESKADVRRMLPKWREIRDQQLELWYTDYATQLRDQLWEAARHLGFRRGS